MTGIITIISYTRAALALLGLALLAAREAHTTIWRLSSSSSSLSSSPYSQTLVVPIVAESSASPYTPLITIGGTGDIASPCFCRTGLGGVGGVSRLNGTLDFDVA
ncbi:hypothetical protein F4776DRAFT_405283 [Hypoxylon sp. NC0597]|nr:hypothetical protein F4776DRAFT_405283 [Hypoxylon sp. NC0597]